MARCTLLAVYCRRCSRKIVFEHGGRWNARLAPDISDRDVFPLQIAHHRPTFHAQYAQQQIDRHELFPLRFSAQMVCGFSPAHGATDCSERTVLTYACQFAQAAATVMMRCSFLSRIAVGGPNVSPSAQSFMMGVCSALPAR